MEPEKKYTVGVDFGTESCRALIVDLETGEEVANAVHIYAHGVIDRFLPGSNIPLPPETALQAPGDYLEALGLSITDAIRKAGIDNCEIAGIGIAFTSCTILPTLADGTPLAQLPAWNDRLHAWPKLWKHHSAQPEADEITELARLRNTPWIERYGGRVSAEWLHSKALEILHDDPEVFHAADCIVEAGDWVVWQLTGRHQRSACNAGYKALWNANEGYPSETFLAELQLEFAALRGKLEAPIVAPGSLAGIIPHGRAERYGLQPGTAVAAGTIDAHAAVAGSGAASHGDLVMVLGTSSCHMLLGNEELLVPGISGVVRDGILPGFFGYEAGQAGVGDSFDWLAGLLDETFEAGSEHSRLVELEFAARQIPPGRTGLLVLDWWNGNRSTLNDSSLSGLVVGLTTSTTRAELYRAMMEATGFGLRTIVEQFVSCGVQVRTLIASGGIAQKNNTLLQIYADILQMPITVASSKYCSALGAAMLGANAYRIQRGMPGDLPAIIKKLTRPPLIICQPNQTHSQIYDELFKEYARLYKLFGVDSKVMNRLREFRRGEQQEIQKPSVTLST